MRNAVLGVLAVMLGVATAAQSSIENLRFEVASIKPDTAGVAVGRSLQTPEGRFLVKNESLKSLIAYAFEIDDFKIIAPSWTEDSRFDIEATTHSGVRKKGEIPAMMRALLADRFGLRAHREVRDSRVYMLTRLYAERLGPNLRAVTVDCQQRTPGQPPPCRLVGLPNGMHAFAQNWSGLLTGYLARPLEGTVVDATGLSEQFDITLEWPRPSDGIPIGGGVLAAVEEQLGLKLSSEKRPVEHVVVDSIQGLSPN